MVNKKIILERLKEIENKLRILKDIGRTDLNKFVKDEKICMSAERGLEVCIQALLDIAHHIIAQNSWGRAQDNKDAIVTLASHNVIPDDFAEKIVPMAGLRNLLVHEYIKIDPTLIHQNLQHLEDFREFSRYILKYLKLH